MARPKIAKPAKKKSRKSSRIGRPRGSRNKKRGVADMTPLELADYFCEVAARLQKGGMQKEEAVAVAAEMLGFSSMLSHASPGGH